MRKIFMSFLLVVLFLGAGNAQKPHLQPPYFQRFPTPILDTLFYNSLFSRFFSSCDKGYILSYTAAPSFTPEYTWILSKEENNQFKLTYKIFDSSFWYTECSPIFFNENPGKTSIKSKSILHNREFFGRDTCN